jgi:hypothetical protein
MSFALPNQNLRATAAQPPKCGKRPPKWSAIMRRAVWCVFR